jgi:hypothetical protein
MRWIAVLLVSLALSIPGRPQAPADPSERARAMAALERLIATGEPRHSSHDEGEWLQQEVERAFALNDAELLRLAKRAANPVVVSLSPVISPTTSLPWLSVRPVPVLGVRNGGKYQADVMVSVDGGEPVRLGTPSHPAFDGGFLDEMLPPQASAPGRHTLRLTARLTFDDRTLGVETRELPEVAYGIYQPESTQDASVRSFIDAARKASARDLDPSLPEVAFAAWLKAVAKAAPNADFQPERDYTWQVSYCDERLGEERPYSAVGDLCTVAQLEVADGQNGTGRIWIRTGRIERVEGNLRWSAVAPSVEGIELRTTDVARLSELPSILALPASAWPAPDISVHPEDIRLTREGEVLHVQAIVRNGGAAAAYDVQIHLTSSKDAVKRSSRTFVRTIPANSFVEVTADLENREPYGEVMLHALQVSEHARQERWSPDPTPDDEAVFRTFGTDQAPPGYVLKLRGMCGNGCRGY